MGPITRAARSALGVTTSVSMSLTAFGLPFLLASWVPAIELVEVVEAPERTVYVDLSSMALQAEGEVQEIPPLPVQAEPEEAAPEEVAAADEPEQTEAVDPEGPLTEPLPEDSPWGGSPDPLDALADASDTVQERAPIDWDAVRARRLARKRTALEKRRADARAAKEKADRDARLAAKCEARKVDIERVDSDIYQVSPDVMATYVADLDEAMQLAYADWALDERGKKMGVEIKRVRYCNPLHQAGFRKGDVITSIEGKSVKNIPQAWAMWRKVKRSEHIEVELMRKGVARTFRYEVG